MARVKMLVSIASADWSYQYGQEVELDDDLAKTWVDVGHAEYAGDPLVANDTTQIDLPEDIKSLGGGWYELPNGEKVKGKTEAMNALTALHADPNANSEQAAGGGVGDDVKTDSTTV